MAESFGTRLDRSGDEKANLGNPSSTTLANPDTSSQAAPQKWKAGRAEWMILLIVAFLSLMVALDAAILVTVLPTVAQALHGDATDAFWAGTSYLVTQAVLQPFIVSLSDKFGRRLLYLISLAFFTVGALVCCFAPGFPQFHVGRAIQGVGGGGLLALANVISTDIVPLRYRPTYLAVNGISWAIGCITGPLIGGLLAQHSTWRWIFYLNFPFCGIGFAIVPWVIRLHAKRASLKHQLLHVDWVGAFLFVSSTCSFLIGLTWGGTNYPWNSWRTLVPLVVGVLGLFATGIYEHFGATHPFIRLQVFGSASAMVSFGGAMMQGLLMFTELYYIPFYLESVKGYTPTIAGVALMPLMVAIIPASIIVGRLMTKFGSYRWAIWSGWIIVTTSTGLLILLDSRIEIYAWVFILFVVGLGHGLLLISLNFSIQAATETRDVAYAAVMFTFLRTFGMCIGVAIGGTVFQNQLRHHLAKQQLPIAVASDAEGFVATLKQMPSESFLHQQYIHAYTNGFHTVFELLVGVAGLGGLLSVFTKAYSMDKDLDSEHVLHSRMSAVSRSDGRLGSC